MYGTHAKAVGGGLAVTGLAAGSHIIAGLSFLIVGVLLMTIFRKPSTVRP